MTTITHADMRANGYCNRGARGWFIAHNLDWYKFRHGGLPAAQLMATGDAQAIRLVRWVENGRK